MLDGAADCLVAILQTHSRWIPVASEATRAISALAGGGNSTKIVSLLRKAGCCSALVKAVCVHHRGLQGEDEAVSASLLFLRDLLRSVCDMLDPNRVDPGELSRCRACFLREGAHEAVVLVTRTHKISTVATTPTTAGILVATLRDPTTLLSVPFKSDLIG